MSSPLRIDSKVEAFSASNVSDPFNCNYQPQGANRISHIQLDGKQKAKAVVLAAVVGLVGLPFLLLPGLIGGACMFLWKTAQYKKEQIAEREALIKNVVDAFESQNKEAPLGLIENILDEKGGDKLLKQFVVSFAHQQDPQVQAVQLAAGKFFDKTTAKSIESFNEKLDQMDLGENGAMSRAERKKPFNDLLFKQTHRDHEREIASFLTDHLGPLSNVEAEAIQVGLRDVPDLYEFIQHCRIVQKEPWSLELFNNSKRKEGDLLDPLASMGMTLGRSLLGLVKTINNKLICYNTQVNTDSFAIGLFIKDEVNEVLGFDSSTEGRSLEAIPDAQGYVEAGKYMCRASWLKCDPSTIIEDKIPFVSGTRQICIKLPNGGRQEAAAHLDFSSLGEMNFFQNHEALRFVRELGGEILSIVPLYEGLQKNQIQRELISESSQEILQKLSGAGLSDKQLEDLIGIAVEFNYKLYMEMVRAYRSVSPDIKAGYRDQISHLIGATWNDYEVRIVFEKLWKTKEGLSKTQDFLDQMDRIQYLEAFQKSQDEIQLAKKELNIFIENLCKLAASPEEADQILMACVGISGVVPEGRRLTLINAAFGGLKPEDRELLENFSKLNRTAEFLDNSIGVAEFLDNLIGEYLLRSEPRSAEKESELYLKTGYLPLFVGNICKRGPLENKASEVTGIILDFFRLIYASNVQIATDGFANGLFNPDLPEEKTLKFATPAARGHGVPDALGYQGKRIKTRALWTNVEPRDVFSGDKPFVSAVRQICYKLPSGARREAVQNLDFQGLGPLSLDQSRIALQLVHRCLEGCSPEDLSALKARYDEKGELALADMQGRHGEIDALITQMQSNGLFVDDNLNKLIEIAVLFSYRMVEQMSNASRDLSPGLKASCMNQLTSLDAALWENKEIKDAFEALWEKNGLEATKAFLDQIDRMQYLSATHQMNEEQYQSEKQALATLALAVYTGVDDATAQETLADACQAISSRL